jgi:hypothetical protein
MSTSCPSAFEFSCPEIVPVTVNQTIINIGDSPAMHRVQRFRYGVTADGTQADNKTLSLSYYPYEPTAVQVTRNTGVQRYGIDYTIQGQYVVLTTELADLNDEVYVSYLSVAGTVASQGATVGSIVAAAGTALDGFVRMDGASRLWSSYGSLQTWFWNSATPVSKTADDAASHVSDAVYYSRRSALLSAYDATNFTLVLLQDVSYNGDTLVTLNKFIKT